MPTFEADLNRNSIDPFTDIIKKSYENILPNLPKSGEDLGRCISFAPY